MGSVHPVHIVVLAFLITAVKPKDELEYPKSQSCELDLAQLLLLPPDSIQVQRLKQELFRYLEEKLEENEFAKTLSNSLGLNNKLGETDITGEKRSIANLAKNGQLPVFARQDGTNDKRSIASLARNGELHSKRELSSILGELTEKRNVASLARGYNFPVGKRLIDLDDDEYEKRNIASIARNSGKRNYDYDDPYGKSYIYNEFKRNLASIAREMGARYSGKRNVEPEDGLQQVKTDDQISENDTEKRNIASLKAQLKGQRKYKRDKRQTDYNWQANDEYPLPVYQNNNVYDYEEFIRALTGQYPNTEKRFLGSVARTGWFKPVTSSRYEPVTVSKRHIGALAKLGWLPSLRSARRFNRSGRSTREIPASEYARTDPPNGSAENDTEVQDSSLDSVKRYLLLPALDNILLRKLYYNSLPSNQESP